MLDPVFGGEGEGGILIFAYLGRLTIEHASLFRRKTGILEGRPEALTLRYSIHSAVDALHILKYYEWSAGDTLSTRGTQKVYSLFRVSAYIFQQAFHVPL